MSVYEVKGRVALVTGAGSGIGHALTEILLVAGCSVVMADIKLRPEAELTLAKYEHPDGPATAMFHQTDLTNWMQINDLWAAALQTFGRLDIVVSVAGIYEPPWSRFWNPPGISCESRDAANAAVGQYKTIAVNQVAPIRLAQIAIDYWTQNRHVEGNFLAVSSMAAFLHSLETPLYMATKAALVSFVKSLGGLRDLLGIRVAAVCPGPVLVRFTP
jgi:NAD(P)-dependent dehydrogenase (short-subunit alcohol dehydrogenase family)